MQLRHLQLGSRFQLMRSGQKYMLNSAQISRTRLFAKEEGTHMLVELSNQCEVKPVIRCDGQFVEKIHFVMASNAYRASNATKAFIEG